MRSKIVSWFKSNLRDIYSSINIAKSHVDFAIAVLAIVPMGKSPIRKEEEGKGLAEGVSAAEMDRL